jgi:hypothetical protein
MQASFHRFSELFAQLGLPTDEPGIQSFLNRHANLPPHVQLADAPFWTPAQAAMLREELVDDADWAEVIDQLNLALHPQPDNAGADTSLAWMRGLS